ncbi:MAG TPA: M50 family metallopeptidase [Candidatus Sulfotelmatobacter sp.]|nr:M50 family metallopeptidase [Candidatus Sulfotelmatobacter sp.]
MTLERLVVYLLMLSVLVVLHEYGHFLVARRSGVKVTDFAVGMGPTLAKWTSPRSGTNYRFNLLPIGGYCQMKGEDGKTNEAEQQREFRTGVKHDPDNFQAKTPLTRLGIVLAGPIANFIVALVLLFGGALAFGIPAEAPTTTIYELVPHLPAANAGLQAGDKIVSIDGKPMTDGTVLVRTIHGALGKPLRVVYQRNGVDHALTLTPVGMAADPKNGHLGFTPLPTTQRVGIAEALSYSWREFAFVWSATLGALGGLIVHPASVIGQVQGPIGMARAASQAQEFGPFFFVAIAAMISTSLGIFNLLPIPALDGGRGAFIVVEMLRGKPVDPEKEALVHFGGIAVLIVLMLLVSFHDIASALAGQTAF